MGPQPPPSAPGTGQIKQGLTEDSQGIGGLSSIKVWEDQFDKLAKIVDDMVPHDVEECGKAFQRLASEINDTVWALHKEAGKIVQNWGGGDADKAVQAMGKVYRQAQEIYDVSKRTGDAMVGHASKQRTWKEWYGSDGITGSWVREVVRWAAYTPAGLVTNFLGNNIAAGACMDQVNEGTKDTYNKFPDQIRQDLPEPKPDEPKFNPDGPGGPGSPKMPGPDGPGDLPKPPQGPGDLPKDGPRSPSGPSELPDGGPGSGGSSLAGMGGGGGGAPGGGLGAGGGMPGGAPTGGAGAGAGGPGAGGMGAGGLGRGMPFGGMPMGMGGGQGGGDNDERERTTWLTEDEDVWGGDDDAGPSVIG
jgi:hypothetical protein